MKITLNLNSIEDYKLFLQAKQLPVYKIRGREIWFPDEYAARLGINQPRQQSLPYTPAPFLFDYQRDIAKIALGRTKFAAFWECGLGKTLLILEFARTVRDTLRASGKGVLIFSPLMVVEQTISEAQRFYGDELPIEFVPSGKLNEWLETCGGKIGITNYEALRNDIKQGNLGCIICDESSMLKSAYGKYAQALIELGRGIEWKLCCTGTPAPNDRIEYANHAVFLDQFPNNNSFLAKYFINRGQTQERWVMKPYALESFYRDLSHWCIFLNNPATYGWKDNCGTIPPINVHIHDLDMTAEQTRAMRLKTGNLIATNPGGITKRKDLSKIAKGLDGSETVKYQFMADLESQWHDSASTIIWCWANEEQDRVEKHFPGSASIQGSTPMKRRRELLQDFQEGRRRVLVSKPDVLGFGLNLQISTKHIFSSLIDSYEDYWQAIKRSNRIGSTDPLDVHIPLLEIERPMAENVLRKAVRVEQDTAMQERIFLKASGGGTISIDEVRSMIELDL